MGVERIARLSVEIGAKIKAFQSKMAQVTKRTESVRRGFTKLGASAKRIGSSIRNTASRFGKAVFSMKGAILGLVTGLVAKRIAGFINSITTIGDQIAKTAKKVGASVEVLSGLRLASELAGTSFNAVTTGFRRLSAAAVDAKDGLAESKRAFDRLGISVTDETGNLKSIDQLFFEVADSIAGMEDKTLAAALAQRVLGRAGLDLIPLLQQGSAAIREQIEEAKRLGIVFTEEDAKAAEDFKDELTRLRFALFGLGRTIFSKVIPALTKFFTFLKESFIATRGDAKEFATDVGEFVKGLAFVIIGAVETIKAIFNGLKLILLGVMSIFIKVFIEIERSIINTLKVAEVSLKAFGEAFAGVFNFILQATQTFSTAFAQALGGTIEAAIKLAVKALESLIPVINKIPGSDRLTKSLAKSAAAATRAADSVRGVTSSVVAGIASFEKIDTVGTGAVEDIQKAIKALSEDLILNEADLIKVNKALRDVADSEAVPFWERAREKIVALNEAIEQYKIQLAATEEAQTGQAAGAVTNFEAILESMREWLGGAKTIFEDFEKLAKETFQRFVGGFGKAVGDAIIFGRNFATSIKALFADIAAGIIASLVKIIITALIAQAALSFFGGGAVTNVAAAGAQAARNVGSVLGGFTGAVPGLAHGGIVTSPTLAMIGERGPEAVIPLGAGGGMGSTTIIIELDGEEIAKSTVKRMPDTIRMLTGFES